MGIYLNGSSAYTLYKSETTKPYFVDKTRMIAELIPLVEQGGNCICVTRPRRFGKTMAADMIASYFSRGMDSADIFDSLWIGGEPKYEAHRNQHHVIQISFNKIPRRCKTYEQYISRIENQLLEDLQNAYPEAVIREDDAVWDALLKVYSSDHTARFIFVLDEWDFIFHRSFATPQDQSDYIDFLSNLLKNQPYVEFAYITGILPIAKYSSGSELNMFQEYTMATKGKYSEYFGFTDEEVDGLYLRYQMKTKPVNISREGLRLWYDGYQTIPGKRMYNPRSVICALGDNQLGSYWTSSGPYDEIFYYIKHNVADVRDDLALMVSGIPVPAKIQEYAATYMNLTTKDEIFSAMIVYGFLSYEKGCVSIPNKELMDKFDEMLRKEPSLGYVNRLAKESERMLAATKAGDTETMLQILAYAHDTEIPLLSYSNETDLTAVVNLVYLAARDYYRIEREDKAGIGYVDFIFYPDDYQADCMILELKADHTAQEAINQIKDRRYALKFRGKIGEERCYTGRILAVGIAYDKVSKKHSCMVEEIKQEPNVI
ncbi:MAG: AAA family ATPase [Lachnospiraceae bacterium]|nr:AAA family ATPase [Lachnospiraceae bacterium]